MMFGRATMKEENRVKTVVPVTARGQMTVDKILDATLRILQSQGYNALTTNHVADLAGIRVGSLYRFFSNKEAIVIALVERWFSSIVKTTDNYIASQPGTVSFTHMLQGLFLVNAEQEYNNNAAYQEVLLATSTVPVLKSIGQDHQRRVASRMVPVYKRCSKGIKSNAEVLEFAVFMHGLLSTALSQLADLKPKARARHMLWTEKMIVAAVSSFESS